MSASHRPVPRLPVCSRARSIGEAVKRSYPTGRKKFSRAICGHEWVLTISTATTLHADVRAVLVTTVNSNETAGWMEYPFIRIDENTLACRLVPKQPGMHLFWARFSLDSGATWQHDCVPDAWVLVDPPDVDQVRMYTLIPSASGTLADWTRDLEAIAAMGFNAVHLLPLTRLDTSRSPYSARDLFEVDPVYLDPDGSSNGLAQLGKFTDRAKELGLRLCFDLVLNHIGTDSYLVKSAPEWIVPDSEQPDGLRRARFWSEKGWQNWEDIVLLNYEHPSQHIRADIYGYMTQYALFWADYANRTNGFLRFDNLHSSDKNFVDELTVALRKEYPAVGVVAEYFTDTDTLLETVPKWQLNLVLATPWDRRFVPQLREYLKYIHSISEQVRFFMPVTSHDSGTPAQEFGAVESTVPRYVAAALLGTGATGITQGVEWGLKRKIEFIGKPDRMIRTGVPLFGDFIRRINAIVAGEPAFRCGNNCEFIDNNHHAIIAAFRKDPRPEKTGFLVICNFDIFHEQLFEADLSRFVEGSIIKYGTDLLTGKELPLVAGGVRLIMPLCSAVILEL